VEEPDSTLMIVLSMFPVTSPLSMVMRTSVSDVPVVEIMLSLGLLVLGVVFAVWLSGRLFRVNTLLMGNTPKLKEIPRLLFGG
jgi:ABC-2 type transport system permease protein